MGERVDFLQGMHAAVDRLFAHRKVLRRRQEIIAWDRLETIDPAEFVGIVDRVCQRAHELLPSEGSA